MAITETAENHRNDDALSAECEHLLSSLPTERGWRTPHLYKYRGFWCQPKEIQAVLSVHRNFLSADRDVILASIPKSGTTWLKALSFSILNRKLHPPSSRTHPLLSSNPHDLVPFLEYKLYADGRVPDLSQVPQPRLFATHVPVAWWPDSFLTSGCRVVYVCRNPFDTFVSSWHFLMKARPESMGPMSLEEGFEMYCRGVMGFGPFWAHMLGYWWASLERPDKVLFLKYEDMKDDAVSCVRKVAAFLGCPLSAGEEAEGVAEEIARLCSFQTLKELEVNKSGKQSILNFENKSLFRKGEVGDWVNYLSPAMVKRLSKVMEEKLGGSGLNFKVFS